MLFITSRMPTVNTEPELNTSFVFDLGNNSSSRGFFCCSRNKKGAIEEIGSKNFLTAIKESKYRQVLIYIHGFSNLPEDVFTNVEGKTKGSDPLNCDGHYIQRHYFAEPGQGKADGIV